MASASCLSKLGVREPGAPHGIDGDAGELGRLHFDRRHGHRLPDTRPSTPASPRPVGYVPSLAPRFGKGLLDVFIQPFPLLSTLIVRIV